MDGHDHDWRIQREAEVARRGLARREVVAGRGVQPGRADDVDAGRVLAHRDDPPSVFLVADEVEVAELGDRVAQRIVERPERLLAAVEVDDRDAFQGRGERGRGRLEAVADEQERIRRRLPECGTHGLQRRGRLVCGRRVRRGVVVTEPGQDDVRLEAVRPNVVDRVAVPRRQVHATDQQPQLQVRVGADRRGRRVEDPPVLAAGREDRDRSSRVALLDHRAGRSTWRVVGRPMRSVARAGERPVPGRCATRSSASIVVPAGRSRAQCRLRRATAAISRSAAVGTLSPSPTACAVVAMAVDHRGELVRLQRHRLVRPGRPRSRVRCFSMIAAPSAVAATGSSMPGVWSDQPVGSPNASRIVAIAARFASAGAAG